jgi:hypothetical protein
MVLKWFKFDKDLLVVACEKEKYENFFDVLDGEWLEHNDQTHFFVSVSKECELQKIIDFINIEELKNSSVKYICPQTYYKSFASKPVDFKKIHDIDCDDSCSSYSSSSYGTSSSDGFPSPETPGVKEYDSKELFEILSDLKHRVRNLERKVYE